jgi:hypothetical protein
MSSALTRRIELLELAAPFKTVRAEFDLAALAARLAAIGQRRQAYEAMSVPDKIKAKDAELLELRAREPDQFLPYRIRLVEIDLEQLHGAAPEACEEARAEAAATVTGRRYSKPGEWRPVQRSEPEVLEGDIDEQPVIGHRPRQPAASDAQRIHDRLEHYRSTGCLWLEPDRP